LREVEEKRAAEREVHLAALRARFVEGPVLILPRGRNASFVTTGVTPIPGVGTVFPQYRVAGEWGSLEADLVLVSTDGRTLRLPGPVAVDGSTLSGDGWSVTLSPGWTAHPAEREGDLEVRRTPPVAFLG
ncbi:MAG: hypothetical protein LC732_02280, partial [Acidobacteria bacterium]|nr:hypothetical protein [Acidobacteriota bacterium]